MRENLDEKNLLPALPQEELVKLLNIYQMTKDQEVREKIITHNLRLISKTISFYFASADRELYEDIFFEGVKGLEKAVDLFDPYQGIKFSSYAVVSIRRTIMRFLMEEEKHKGVISLDTPIENEEGEKDTSLVDFIPSDEDVFEEGVEKVDKQEKMKIVAEFIETLKPKHQQVFISVWGLGRKKQTHKEVAKELGVSYQRVSQLAKATLASLQKYFIAHAKLSKEEKDRLRKIVGIKNDIDDGIENQ